VRKSLLALLLTLALPAFAGQSGTTTRPAELRSSTLADGKVLQTLPANTKVDVVKRVGGWYEVRTAAGAQGWVRLWLLRFSTQTGGGAALKENVAVLGSGRSSSTYTTATTGVRGLSEEELAKAVPDPAAVQALEKLAVTPADARGFANKIPLKADPEALKK
jgi:uncharacterized protein YgiM (DUF1202 family)